MPSLRTSLFIVAANLLALWLGISQSRPNPPSSLERRGTNRRRAEQHAIAYMEACDYTHAYTHGTYTYTDDFAPRILLHDNRRLRAHKGDGADARVLHANEFNSSSILPNPLVRPTAHRPRVPALHQGVKRNGALRDGLLPGDEHRVRAGGAVPVVRPVPHPYRVDHVHDRVSWYTYYYVDDYYYALLLSMRLE
ncbi:hypothetical protein F5Y19DRAFT_475560 [Xylariaceae sp. FL1651]|nr:hypothetical protein F5Y19DRAFT_475560 [Xylariaceae sp. FL1651]